MLDVTKTGTCPRRFNTDGDELAGLLGRVCSQCQCFLKSRTVLDHVIRRKDDHRGRMITTCHPTGAKGNRGRSVTLGRFGHDIFLRQIGKQFTNCRFLLRVCQDENTFARHQTLKTRDRFFQKSFVRDQLKQLLRPGPAAQRPETFTAPASENQRVDRIGHVNGKDARRLDLSGCEDFPISFFETRRIW